MLKIAYHPIYKHPLPDGHRFPMIKYELLPQQLQLEGICTAANFFAPTLASKVDIIRAHEETYYNRLINLELTPKEIRKSGFPLSDVLVKRERIIAQGTINNCHYALEYGVSMNIAGGTHHAYTNRAEAFCLLNDQAIAAHYLLFHQLAKKILIIDLDVHQGNGTAEIFSNEPRVFTFSMHGEGNYPFKKETSDLDIALAKNTDDATYLKLLSNILPNLMEEQQPDFIFYLSGVDVLATDKLGTLGMSIEGCAKRDALVFKIAKENNIPIQCSMGGGYSPDIKIILKAHVNTYKLAQEFYF
ncbi:histone deacetylase [Croceivirga sp. JEA036]|uniref:histone deacetylase family protein n=1 Tax=Croceivirga sp. JEA036 TaxID=2721162 RepID=UPI001439E7D0|nr:histone deacetylase [Croceivirga sp. JEA036]NJB36446.1 histone deacetylase [Croceivirga sp. JEA036]